MAKRCVYGVGKFYYHYPASVPVVTVEAGGIANAMAAAWHAPVSFSPPLYGVSISPKRFTYELITEAREFALNFLPQERAEIIAAVGGSSGRTVEKFEHFGIAWEESAKIKAPLLQEAYAAYECRLVSNHTFGDHEWFVGEVVAVHYLEEAFDERGVLNLDCVQPPLYLGAELYLDPLKGTVRYLDRRVYGQT